MIAVLDPGQARAQVRAGRVACPEPGCTGVMRIWSRARPRRIQLPDGELVQVRPDRARCRACKVTHVLLPAWCVPRRAYAADVIGAALFAAACGAGVSESAVAAGAPAATVRGWLRAVTRGAPALTACAVLIAQSAGDATVCWAGPSREASALTCAVNALATAAQSFRLSIAVARLAAGGRGPTGINYLALLSERNRRSILHRLHVGEPTPSALARATPWHLINILTGGRLLTTRTG